MRGTDGLGASTAVQSLLLGHSSLSWPRDLAVPRPRGEVRVPHRLFCGAGISSTTHHVDHTLEHDTPHHLVIPRMRRERTQPGKDGGTQAFSPAEQPLSCLFLGCHLSEILGLRAAFGSALGSRLLLNSWFGGPGGPGGRHDPLAPHASPRKDSGGTLPLGLSLQE